jgi:beta-glucosidase
MQKKEMNEKIEQLIDALTLEEKISMLHGASLFETAGVERLNIPPLKMSDGPMGVRAEFKKAEWIPVGTPVDYVTYCPSNSAIAMTWNRQLAAEAGRVLGEETRGRGKDIILAPGINIKRIPNCGRNFEYFSEDPFLISQLVVPLIQGIESADVAACVKHFALNNQETERLWVNVEIDERALREIYLPGFEAAVKEAGVKSLMGAYNLLFGEHCCQSKWLLGKILRKEWEFDGLIVSDWGAVHSTQAAATSPLDIEMSVTPDFDDYYMANPLLAAIQKGEIAQDYIDEKIYHILLLMFRLKMITTAVEVTNQQDSMSVVLDPERKKGSYNTPEHRQKVLDVAREAIVLLKNEQEKLPLKEKQIKKLLVIGQNAVVCHASGGGSAEIKALYETPPLLGITEFLGGNCEVTYLQGYEIPKKEETDKNWQEDSLKDSEQLTTKAENCPESEHARQLREEAVLAAGQYDEVIFVGGINHEGDVEGQDREDLNLPYGQDRLIQDLLDVNPEMTVVMVAGSPVCMKQWLHQAKAVIWMGYCGMEGGKALAEILFGQVNPSGKLAETMPFSLADTSIKDVSEYPGRALTKEEQAQMNAHVIQNYTEGVFIGYRYYEKHQIPVQFCFGHGLSYTSFAYQQLHANYELSQDGSFQVTVTLAVENTGTVKGKEIVQLYLGEKVVREENPVKELKGFQKIALEPGEKETVTFCLTEKDFAHYVEAASEWNVRKEAYLISVGSSLVDIRDCVEVDII